MDPFVTQTNKTIRSFGLIRLKDIVLVGVSGGPDSVCLLDVLLRLKKKYGTQISVCHINYASRKNSSKDELFVRSICSDRKVDCYYYRVKDRILRFEGNENTRTVRESDSLTNNKNIVQAEIFRTANFEDRARRIRFAVFHAIAEKRRFTRIAVGSNANDQAETILMHFLRGSGLSGISGMNFKSGKIVRPLLSASRKNIESYLKRNKIRFRTDESNKDTHFVRNKLRLNLIPKIEREYNPNIVATLTNNSVVYRKAQQFIDEAASAVLASATVSESKGHIAVSLKAIAESSPAVKSTIVRKIVDRIKGNLFDISSDVIEKTVSYLTNPQKKAKFLEIKGLTVAKNGGTVTFRLIT